MKYQNFVAMRGRTQVKRAFTLAEVLITLVIIGVIAAITVPTLMNNYQKNKYLTQLKHSYSLLSNGFKLAMAKDGVTRLEDTALFSSIEDVSTNIGEQKAFRTEFSKVFTLMKSYDSTETPEQEQIEYTTLTPGETFIADSEHRVCFNLNNGAMIYGNFYKTGRERPYTVEQIKESGSKLYQTMGYMFIDVNGAQKPNKVGRDLFYFLVGNDGTVFPFGGKDHSLNVSLDDTNYWRTSERCQPGAESPKNGIACAGRIFEEGWQMNY